jgi:GNAT superfamily N-acetyltransferase
MIEIREANNNDFNSIIALAQEFAAFENKNDPTLCTNWPLEEKTQEFFKKCIKDKDKLTLICTDNETPVGYLVAWIHDSLRDRPGIKLVIIENVFLQEKYRSEGLGKELINEAQSWAREIGSNRLAVTAFSANINALGFYKRHGFKDYKLTLEKEI